MSSGFRIYVRRSKIVPKSCCSAYLSTFTTSSLSMRSRIQPMKPSFRTPLHIEMGNFSFVIRCQGTPPMYKPLPRSNCRDSPIKRDRIHTHTLRPFRNYFPTICFNIRSNDFIRVCVSLPRRAHPSPARPIIIMMMMMTKLKALLPTVYVLAVYLY